VGAVCKCGPRCSTGIMCRWNCGDADIQEEDRLEDLDVWDLSVPLQGAK
jgi:hypothetical protein